ncbi:MAG: M56 family metallopeptidase [Fimbriimonas sp.]
MNGEGFVRAFAVASIHGALFVLAIGLLALACRRLPAWVRAWFWWIACAQFLVRLFLTVPIPVPAAPPGSEAPIRSEVVRETILSASSPFRRLPPEVPSRSPAPGEILAVLWAIGVAVGVGVSGRRLIGAHRLVREAVAVEESPAVRILAELTGPGRRMPRLLQSSTVKCPLLTGYLRPAIVIPAGFAAAHAPEEVRMALAHEVAHLRRRDQWLALVVTGVQILFFFHPFVWLAAREASLSREEACDVEALRLSGADPAAYAHFLVKSAQGRTPVAALGAAYGYRNLRRRITMLKIVNPSAQAPRTHLWKMLIAAGIGAALPWTVVAQTAPKPAAEKPAVVRSAAPAPASPSAKPSKVKPAQRANRAAKPSKAGMPATGIAPAKAKPADSVAAFRSRTAVPAADVAAVTEAQPARAVPAVEQALERAVPSPNAAPAEDATAAAASSVDPTQAIAHQTRSVFEISIDPSSGQAPMARKATVKLVRADLEASLVKLLNDSGNNFVIKGRILPESISCGFTDMPVQDVLMAILQGSEQNLTFRYQGDVLFILPGEPEATATPAAKG